MTDIRRNKKVVVMLEEVTEQKLQLFPDATFYVIQSESDFYGFELVLRKIQKSEVQRVLNNKPTLSDLVQP